MDEFGLGNGLDRGWGMRNESLDHERCIRSRIGSWKPYWVEKESKNNKTTFKYLWDRALLDLLKIDRSFTTEGHEVRMRIWFSTALCIRRCREKILFVCVRQLQHITQMVLDLEWSIQPWMPTCWTYTDRKYLDEFNYTEYIDNSPGGALCNNPVQQIPIGRVLEVFSHGMLYLAKRVCDGDGDEGETLSEIKDGRVNRMLGFIIHSRVESAAIVEWVGSGRSRWMDR